MAAEKKITPLSSTDDVALYQQGLWYLKEGEHQDIYKAGEYFYYSVGLNKKNKDGGLSAVAALETLDRQGKLTPRHINMLGASYHNGWVGYRDYKKAHAYYLRVIDADYSLGMTNAGNLYCYGYGVTQNKLKAAGYYFDGMFLGKAESDTRNQATVVAKKGLALLANSDPFLGYSPLEIAYHINHKVAIEQLSLEDKEQALRLALLYQNKTYIEASLTLGTYDLPAMWEQAFSFYEGERYELRWLVSLCPESGLLQAAKKGCVGLIKAALDCGVNIDATDARGWSAICYAIAAGHNDVVKTLIDAGAALGKLSDGTSLLHIAAQYNNAAAITLLVAAGCNDFIEKNAEGETPLHVAAKHGQLETAKVLMNDDTITVYNDHGQIPLHCAAGNNQHDVMSLLLMRLDFINIPSKEHKTALQIAVESNHREAVILLLQHGADINASNKDDETPLHSALIKNQYELAKLLINHGANLMMASAAGKKPIDYTTAESGAARVFTEIARVNRTFLESLAKEIARLTKKGGTLSDEKVSAFRALEQLIKSENGLRPLGAYITEWMLDNDGQSLKTIATSGSFGIKGSVKSLDFLKNSLISLNPDYLEHGLEATRPLTRMNQLLKGSVSSVRTTHADELGAASSSSSSASFLSFFGGSSASSSSSSAGSSSTSSNHKDARKFHNKL